MQFKKHIKDSMTSHSLVSSKSLHTIVGVLSSDTSSLVELKDGSLDGALISFSLLSSIPRLLWRRFIKDIMIPHALPGLRFPICYPPRDLRPCVPGCTLLISYHPTLVHCRLERLFVLHFFAFHSQSQISILLTMFQVLRVQSHINNSFWICCPFLNVIFLFTWAPFHI